MGIFGAFGRALTGKQPYGSYTNKTGQAGEPAATGRRVPVVRITRVENRLSGQRLDVYADIVNESGEPIFLDCVLLLGGRRELDSQLQARELRQFVIYSGPLFVQQPTGYVELQYRTQLDGDYFASRFAVRSRQEGDGGYVITECLPAGPVKDIR